VPRLKANRVAANSMEGEQRSVSFGT